VGRAAPSGAAMAASSSSSDQRRSPAAQFWLPPERLAEREATGAVQREAAGEGGWLQASHKRLKEQWDAVMRETWEPGAAASAQPRSAGTGQPFHGWVHRTATDAREWVQTMDSVPMLGDCKHLWYCHGRPTVVCCPQSFSVVFQYG
jgi:hypothetical protein